MSSGRSQRRQRQSHDIEAVEQVFTETARTHVRLEGSIRGGEEPHIRVPLARLAQSFWPSCHGEIAAAEPAHRPSTRRSRRGAAPPSAS